MVDRILFCVDNSAAGAPCARWCRELARVFSWQVVAAHVYAARLHDQRFAELEPTLPGDHQDPKRLEASRRTHDSLIEKGLKLISDSYLDAIRSQLDGTPLEVRALEGKHWVELVKEAANGYGLCVIGARGLGLDSVPDGPPAGLLGSVCERFLRAVREDVLVVREGSFQGPLMACVDGSPESYSALRKALKLADRLGRTLEVVAAFDPHFHPAAFKQIAQVLSEKDSKMFRFKEQEKLHDEIIDRGLESLYQGYLENARFLATGREVALATTLLHGKPAIQIARRAGEIGASVVVVGRHGLHRTESGDMGSTAEAVVRLSPSSVLVCHDAAAPAELDWTEEATARLAHLPAFIQPMVKKAVESHARARGIRQITPAVVSAAKQEHGVPLPGHGKPPSHE
ncbi:MAG: universal stress protein [Planctomycetes bacterium]|nr:universal stress protein [Planctomycetota bacterium]